MFTISDAHLCLALFPAKYNPYFSPFFKNNHFLSPLPACFLIHPERKSSSDSFLFVLPAARLLLLFPFFAEFSRCHTNIFAKKANKVLCIGIAQLHSNLGNRIRAIQQHLLRQF